MAEEVLGRRGEIVIVAVPGDYGKPRPALVVQTDLALPLASVVICLMTSADNPGARQVRVPVAPTPHNGLRKPSFVMVDKLVSVSRSRIKAAGGRLSEGEMAEVTRCITVLLGIE